MATGGAADALRRFELDGVHDTGREVGHGSYAVVKELEYHGLKCVGKKIHGILFESATPHEKAAMLDHLQENVSSLVDCITHVSFSFSVCGLNRAPGSLYW